MAMGMKMGNIDSTQGNESINQKKETETEKKIKPITDKEIQRVNEQLKDPEFKKHLKLLKYLIAKKDSLPEAQQIPIDNALKNIKENLQRMLSDKSELFTDKGLSMLTGSKEYPHQENGMIDNTNADTVATEIAAHFKQDTFKILKAVIKHPEAFGVEFEDEYREIENTIKKEVENIWKELQLQDKQQQIDKVKAVTKVTKGK